MKDEDLPNPAVNPPVRQISRMTAALAPAPAVAAYPNPAEWMYERLKKYIKEFESHLDDDHEVGAHLVSFGHELTFHIRDMGYHGPDIITFYGRSDRGEDVQLVQHVSQLSVLLVAVRKQEPQPRRIGFVLDRKESDADRAIGGLPEREDA